MFMMMIADVPLYPVLQSDASITLSLDLHAQGYLIFAIKNIQKR